MRYQLTAGGLVLLLVAPLQGAEPIPRRPEDVPAAPLALTLPRAANVHHRLSQGASLFVVRDRALPIARLTVYLPGGLAVMSPEDRVIARLATRALVIGGSDPHPGAAFTAAAGRLGARFLAQLTDHEWRLSVEALAEDFPAAVDLLVELLVSPAYPHAALPWANEQLTSAASRAVGDPEARLERAIRQRLEPVGYPGAGVDPLVLLPREAALAWHGRVLAPEQLARLVFAASGDVHPEVLVSQLSSRLPAVEKPTAAVNGGALPTREVTPGLLVVDLPDAREVWVAITHPAPVGVDPLAAQVADFVLGGGFNGRLNQRLREREQLAYYAASALDLRPGGLGPHRVTFRTAPAAAAKAVVAALEELAAWQTVALTAAEWEAARQGFLGATAARVDSPPRRVETFALDNLPGRLPQMARLPADLPARLRALKPADLTRAAQALAPRERRVVVIVGPWNEVSAGAKAAGINLPALAGPLTVELE